MATSTQAVSHLVAVPTETAIQMTTFTVWQVITICLSIVGSAGFLCWWLRGQFAGMNSRLQSVDTDLISIKGWMGALLSALDKKVDNKVLQQLTHQLGTFKAQASGNPISNEEASKLNNYVDMVIAKKDFTPVEALDFKTLVEKFVSDEEIKKNYDKAPLDTLLMVSGGIYGRFYLGLNTPQDKKETKA